MKIKCFVFVVAAVSLAACASKEDKDVIDESLLPPAAAKPAQPAVQQDPALTGASNTQQSKISLPAGANPEGARVTVNPQTAAAQTAPVAAAPTTGEKLNPPHGQPGHRCDINVGAPLNSKPAQQPAVTQATVSNPPTIVNTQATPQQTLPGMNPPHGQPGHRCDIAVGAPLNSKPAPVAAPVTVTPAQKDSEKN